MELRPYQQIVVREIRQAIAGGKRAPLVVSPTGSGKCLAKGTPILMFDGSIKAVENVRVGDRLMGPDSKPRRVLSLARGREAMYRVTPTKGDPYEVNESHILSLKITGTKDRLTCGGQTFTAGQIANVSVRDYLAANKTFRHCAKGWRVGVEFRARRTPAELPPYILGAWLGDGDSKGPTWTGVYREVFQEIKWHALAMGLDTRDEIVPDRCPRVHIASRDKAGRGRRTNAVRAALHCFGLLNNKHVPELYKINSREVRLEVLAGLMDTDGSLSNGVFDFIGKSERLADDVVFLARSVGLAAYKKRCSKTCGNNGAVGTYFRVTISGDVSIITTRIKRKRAAVRRQVKDALVTGIKVEPIGEGDYYGFEIDGDRLFLLGDFTVTHNTVMFSHIADGAGRKGNRVWILVHRAELVDQTSRTMRELGVPHGVIAAGWPVDPLPHVQVVSVQTVVRRTGGLIPPQVIIVDECHHAAAGTWSKILAAFPQAVRLGFTATPERLDGKGLADSFDALIRGPEVGWLIDNGFLTRPVYYAPPNQLNLDGLHVRGGDFAKDELAKEMDKPTITGDAVEHYRRLCPGAPAVAFCASVRHAEHVAQAFQAAGYSAATLDGTLDRVERRRRVRALADGSLRVLTSCEIISEGFDIPVVTAAILLRPTKSLGMHLQQIGRVLRVAPGKDRAYIIDHVGNTGRMIGGEWVRNHGLAEEVREWSLEGRPKKKKKSSADDDAPPVRQCPTCYACHVPAPICPECGHRYEAKKREIEQEDGELVELSAVWMAKQRLQEQGQARTFEELVALGKSRGMRMPQFWAKKVLNARQRKHAFA